MTLKHRIRRLETHLGLTVPQGPLETFLDKNGRPLQCRHGKPYPTQPRPPNLHILYFTGYSPSYMVFGLRCECSPDTPQVPHKRIEDTEQHPNPRGS